MQRRPQPKLWRLGARRRPARNHLCEICARDISNGRAKYRHFRAMSLGGRMWTWKAATPSEKFYSFFLKDLAKVSADNHNHGQAIARQAPDGLKATGSCWEEKSIHEATRRGLRIDGRRWKIASVRLGRPSILDLRSSILFGRLRGRIINPFTV